MIDLRTYSNQYAAAFAQNPKISDIKPSEWAEKNGLYVTQPREVLTVGRQYPSLNKVLAFPEMVLKSTTGINIPTTGFDWWCCVEWKGSRRGAIIDNEVSHFSDTTWYVYKH